MDAERIVDWVSIQDLKAKYFRYLDTKQWAAWRKLFTDDLVFFSEDSPEPTTTEPVIAGGDQFVQMVSRMLQHAVTVHQGHMPEIEFTGPREARGVWAMYDWVESADGWSNQGFGHYHERYEKGADGRWRIAELRLTRLRLERAGTPGEGPSAH